MLAPKKTKYRKAQKGGKKIKGVSRSGYLLKFGTSGIKALESCKLSSKQIESARKVIIRSMKKVGKLWINVFPDIPITKKPAEVRMGSGKGNVEYYVYKVRPGRIIFEVDGIEPSFAEEIFRKAASKLPFKHKFVSLI